MTKYELEALGLAPETIKAIQKIHGADMAKLARKIPGQDPNAATRDAIKAMLPMIQGSDHLKRLLKDATYFYHAENRKKEEAPASAANAGEGKAEQNLTTVSASDDTKNEEVLQV